MMVSPPEEQGESQKGTIFQRSHVHPRKSPRYREIKEKGEPSFSTSEAIKHLWKKDLSAEEKKTRRPM